MLIGTPKLSAWHDERLEGAASDLYFSADVETDGPIPGPYSILSFAIVYAGSFDGHNFTRPQSYDEVFFPELKPISHSFEKEALAAVLAEMPASLSTASDRLVGCLHLGQTTRTSRCAITAITLLATR